MKKKKTDECKTAGTCECVRDTDTLPQSQVDTHETDPTDEEADAFFAELQAVWDEHSRRIDEIIARNDEPVIRFTPQAYRAMRRRLRAERIVFTLLILGTVVALVTAYINNSPHLRLIYSLILVTVAVVTLTHYGLSLSIPLHNRVAEAFSRLRRFLFPQSPRPLACSCAARRVDNAAYGIIDFVSAVLLIVITCYPAADGYIVTSLNRADRAALVASVGDVLNSNNLT